MPRLKRTRDEAELDIPTERELPTEQAELRTKLRNMWEFASLMQYIYLFGSVVKIDDNLDIEVCAKSVSRGLRPLQRLRMMGTDVK